MFLFFFSSVTFLQTAAAAAAGDGAGDGVVVVCSAPHLRLGQLMVDALAQLLAVSRDEEVHVDQQPPFVLIYSHDLQ